MSASVAPGRNLWRSAEARQLLISRSSMAILQPQRIGPLWQASPATSLRRLALGRRLRIGRKLRDGERDAALDRIDFEDPHVDFLGHGQDLPGINATLGLRHLGHVKQAFDAWFEFNEGAVFRGVGYPACEV